MTDWLGDHFTPADFDAALAPKYVRQNAETGQEALFATGTPTRAPKPGKPAARLPGERALFGDDGQDQDAGQ